MKQAKSDQWLIEVWVLEQVGLERGTRELFEMKKMFYILVGVSVPWVDSLVKTD